MRGAVSVALIYRYFDPHGAAALDGHRSTLITTTLLLVLFSTMALGGLTKPMLDYIQGPAGVRAACGTCNVATENMWVAA
jgi:hypothetical protein